MAFIIFCYYTIWATWWLSGRESACQYRRHRFNPWVREIPWRRKWQPTPVFLPGKSHGQRSLVGYNPWGCKRIRRDLTTKQLPLLYYKVTSIIFLAFWYFSLDCWNVGIDYFLIGLLMYCKCPKQFLSLKKHPVNICWIHCHFLNILWK